MSGPLILAIPSKGRLKEQTETWLADCGDLLGLATFMRAASMTSIATTSSSSNCTACSPARPAPPRSR